MKIYFKEDTGYVYCITNKLNNRQYIGYTTKIYPQFMIDKWWSKARSNPSELANDIRNGLRKDFSMKVLQNNVPKEELKIVKKKFIKELKTRKKDGGYN